MKKLIFLLLFFPGFLLPQTYEAKIVIDALWWHSPNEWGANLHVDLYRDGVFLKPGVDYDSLNNSYKWQKYENGNWIDHGNSYSQTTDGQENQTFPWRVIVSGSGFLDTSDVVNVGKYGTIKALYIYVYKEDGSNAYQDVKIKYWATYSWRDQTAGINSVFFLSQDDYNVLKDSTVSLPNQRFNRWERISTTTLKYYTNHAGIYVDANTNKIDLWHSTFHDATVSAVTDGGTAPKVFFKDPWLVEATPSYYEAPYGYKNLGMSAQFQEVENVTNNIGITSKYKGVFLNQAANPGNAYYSVRAPLTPTVNGSTAFFNGWSYSGASLVQADPNPAGYDQKAVVFTSTSGANITANYSYSTISTNTTLNTGAYNIAGTLTVAAGVTLTVNSGATLNFPSGGGLVVNGTLVTNGGTFTSNAASWGGITLNNANGSSIQYSTISKALSPIIISSTNSITILGCTINNSTFYANNPDEAAAIQVRNSSPTISGTTIDGLYNSWNGVRFINSSSGTLTGCTIEYLGSGNGVIVQGGSSPTISYNTIRQNYFHGIVVFQNGSGSPTITGNTLDYNGQSSYIGIHFYTSSGIVRMNTVSHSYYGIWCRYSGSLTAGGVGQTGSNTIINNTMGLVATDNSSMYLGDGIAQKNEYWGICNEIYSNSLYDAVSETGSVITARYNWWGQYPLNQSKFYVDGSSSLDNSYPETSANGCPLSGGIILAAAGSVNDTGSPTLPETNPADEVKLAMENKFRGNYAEASSLCRKLLKDSKAASFHKQALVILFNIFQATGDKSIANDLNGFASFKGDLGTTASLLLASAYAGMGRTTDAETVADNLKAANPNSEIEERALFTLASLSAFNPAYKNKSEAAINELISKYGSSVDKGLIAALGFSVNNNSPKVANKFSSPKPESSNTDSLNYQFDNYPNPFNPSTVIRYVIPKGGLVTLTIYDMLGREVKTLVNEYQNKGRYNVTFNAENLSSGIYIYQLRSNNFVANKKIMLMK